MTTRISLSVVGGLAMSLWPVVAEAQGADSRWQAWVGCWAPVMAQDSAARALGSSVRVCIAPTVGQSAVEVTTINVGKVTSRSVIEATGEPRAVTRDGCEGTETARWSETGRRLYLKSSLRCADGTRRTSSGVLSFTESRQWLDVRGLGINDASPNVAVGRFAPMPDGDSVSVPADVRRATPIRTPAAEYAAVAAATAMTLADIVEVSSNLEVGVASAWLVERTRGLTLAIDGKQLTALADHGVPSAVIDVAVALAYPDVFRVASDSRQAQRQPGVQALTSETPNAACRGMPISSFYYDPCLWSLDLWYYYNAYGRRYGYDYPFGRYGYAYPYGYFGYGYGSPYGWYGPHSGTWYAGGPSVVVIQTPGGAPAQHGRVVKGQGYTSGAGADGAAARPGSSFTPISSSHGSISAGSGASSGSSGSSSSGASSGGDRTAVRKP